VQVSLPRVVQALPSSHAVPSGTFRWFGGQSTLVPVQLSAVSPHCPVTGRHTVAVGMNASAGQAGFAPSHDSATSQPSAAGRQIVVAGFTASGGQAASIPVQVSGPRSQISTTGRHTVPALPGTCTQPCTASHESTVQGLPSSQFS
jgi:hypothetical protein